MKPENSINYYYALQALRLLVERGLLSEAEYEKPAGIVPEFSSQRGGTSSHIGYGLPPRILVVFG